MTNASGRLATAAILLPVLIGLIWFLPPLFFFVGVAAAILRVQYEFYLLALRNVMARGVGLAAGGIWLVCGYMGQASTPILLSLCLALILFILASFREVQTALSDAATLSLGLIYPTGCLAYLILIRTAPGDLGPPFILSLLAIVWGGDAAAYYAGRAFGKHKLAPVVSPNKTVEGAIGGLCGSLAAGLLASRLFHLPFAGMAMIAIPLLVGGIGQLGDLVESMFKRSAGVKDSGSLIPSHGGLFDKLDSVAFAAPLFYYLIQFLSVPTSLK
jgi:phosphatidate cytidylyltransferase